jgi:UDP-N-acetylmuramoylalanine--D-glutamate ligase
MAASRPPLPAGPYLVVGLARSGTAAALLLRERGETVAGVDAGRPDVGRLRDAGVEVVIGEPGAHLVDAARTVVKSPGVPPEVPVLAAARDRGLPVLGELELAWRLLPNQFVAVTGTNGKTTTTELLGHIHRVAGVPVAVAGNVGTPLASLVGGIDPDAVVVAEASSFQLEDTLEFAPDAALLLNLAPDHVDRHGTYEAYVEAKLNAFRRQRPDDLAVAPAGIDVPGRARRATFARGEQLVSGAEVRLRGAHNRENAAAAATVALERGIEPDAIREALRTFGGVPHRLEDVGEVAGVAYVNDSKATNVASTLVALASFAGGLHLILGGLGKGQDFAPLRQPVADRCRAVYLIGRDAEVIAAALEGAGVPLTRAGDLARAVAAARGAAKSGEVVLLSPACASYDQYSSFEERGDHFRTLAAEAG